MLSHADEATALAVGQAARDDRRDRAARRGQLVHREPRGRPPGRRAAARSLRRRRARGHRPSRASASRITSSFGRGPSSRIEARWRSSDTSTRCSLPATFEGYRRDGELARGPGVLDMKGGLVVVAFALKALAATGGLDAVVPVRVVIVGDEEVGSPGRAGGHRERPSAARARASSSRRVGPGTRSSRAARGRAASSPSVMAAPRTRATRTRRARTRSGRSRASSTPPSASPTTTAASR